MRRIVILVSLLVVCARAAAHTRKGYDACTAGNFKTADANEAVKWYRQAAAGLADATESLGALYFFGKGVTQDYAEAAKWYKVAAEEIKPGTDFNAAASAPHPCRCM